jgi:hypothetical protein
VRMQVGRVAASVAVIAAVVSGCGGPEQAGSAVIVGSETVPLETVQSQLSTALAKTDQFEQYSAQGGTAAGLARDIVTREVYHDLLTRVAARDGILVSEAQIDAELEANGGAEATLARTYYDLPTLRERVRDSLIAAQVAQREVPGLAVTADIVAADSREEAEATARTLAAGGPEAAAIFTDPARRARPATTVQAASSPADAATVVFGVPVGTVGAFQPDPGNSGWVVFRVVDRQTDVPSDPAALASLSQAQLATIGNRLLQPTGEAAGIRVNPRYGEWDPVQLRVVPEGQQAGIIILPAAPALD